MKGSLKYCTEFSAILNCPSSKFCPLSALNKHKGNPKSRMLITSRTTEYDEGNEKKHGAIINM